MKNNCILKGIYPALITPFDENQKLLKDSIKKLLDFNYKANVQGFYIGGGTGEGPVLRTSLREEMLETVMEENNNRGQIVVHVGSTNFLDTIELAKHADKLKVDAISCLAPLYQYNYTVEEITDYYKRLASSVSVPVIVYAAGNLSSKASLSMMKELLQIENVAGIKYSLDDYATMLELKRLNNGNITVMNGADDTLLCGLSMGADGGIGATYNVMPDKVVALYDAFTKGDIKLAREKQKEVNDILHTLLKYSKNSSIKSLKAVLGLMGINVGYASYPAEHYSSETLKELEKEMINLGVLK